jgi:hypothetical protein
MPTDKEKNYWKFVRGKNLPPTHAQIALLQKIGISEVPSNSYDAGIMIERHITKGIASLAVNQRINSHSPSIPKLDGKILPIVEEYLGMPIDLKTTTYVDQLEKFFNSLPPEDLEVAPYGFSYHCPKFEKFLQHYLNYISVKHGWISNKSYPLNPRSKVLKDYLVEKWPRDECGYPKSLTQYLEEFLAQD